MKKAYALLGVCVVVVCTGAYFSFYKDTQVEPAIIGSNATNTMQITTSTSLTQNIPFSLTSPSFENNGLIPEAFTCDGEGKNPELSIMGVPDGVRSLVLLMQDPDIPEQFKQANNMVAFDHWVVYNILPSTTHIKSGLQIGEVGLNSAGKSEYFPPCPPPQYEPSKHRYVFTLYALSEMLSFDHAPTLEEVKKVFTPLIVAQSSLIGTYQRP